MPDVPARFSLTEVDPLTTSVSGEIDAHTAPELAAHFAELPDGSGDIVVDVSGVEFMDSSGLRVFIDLHQRAADQSRRLVLRAPGQAVTRLIEIAGLEGHLHVAG